MKIIILGAGQVGSSLAANLASEANDITVVDLDQQKLRALGLRPAQITQAIRMSRASVPAGTIERAGSDIFVKTENKIGSAKDVARIPIQPGSPLRIGNVARVYEDVEDPDTDFFVEGERAAKLTISREETADPLEIREHVLEMLPRLQAEDVPPGLELVMSDDFTLIIRDRLETVVWNALGGAVLVIFVLFVLSGLRQALLALWGMPVSYLAAGVLMDQWGISINVVSTFGLLIATGIIVDDAVVVIENVQRHMERGASRAKATFAGTKEVLLPVTVAVEDVFSRINPRSALALAQARIFCLLGSLVEVIFILPGHLSEFASKDTEDTRTARLARRMKDIYGPPLRFCMRHKYLVLLLVGLGLAGTGALAQNMPFSFGGRGKPFELKVNYEVSPGLSQELTREEGEQILAVVERELGDHILNTTLRVGSTRDDQSGIVQTGANLGSIRWEFALEPELIEAYPEAIIELRRYLATNPDLGNFMVQEVQAGPPAGAGITARIRGRDVEQLDAAVAEVKAILREMKGVYDIRDDYGSGKETFRVRVDQDRASWCAPPWAARWRPRCPSPKNPWTSSCATRAARRSAGSSSATCF